MNNTVRNENALNEFQNTVTLYRDGAGRYHIGNTYYYNGRGTKADYLSIMYRNALPQNTDLMTGWNYLDESGSQVIVPETDAETGVADFCYAHGLEREWPDIDFHTVESYTDITEYVDRHPLNRGEVAAFGIRK